MKFTRRDMGHAAEASSGGGHHGWWRELLTLALLVALTMTALYFGVSYGTGQVLKGLSVEKEKAWFADVSTRFESAPVPPELAQKWELTSLTLEKLLAADRAPALNYRLAFQNEDTPNAYAVPGGVIAVTKGLLNELDDEVSIAFVLAHELGHFAHRDHLRGLGKKLGFAVAVSLVFGGDQITQKLGDLIGLRYSRDQETKADLFGLALVEAAYGETEGAERLFQVLAQQDTRPGWAYMFSTHPDNQNRIRRILEERKKAAPHTAPD